MDDPGSLSAQLLAELLSLIESGAEEERIRVYLVGALSSGDLQEILSLAVQRYSAGSDVTLLALSLLASAVVHSLLTAGDLQSKKDTVQTLVTALIMPCPPLLRDEDLKLLEESACQSAPDLYFDLYKVVAAAANSTLNVPDMALKDRCTVTYRSLGVLARRLRDSGLMSSSEQWSLLEAINVTKDSCPHGNVFKEESLELLKRISFCNKATYENIVRWNACKSALRGAMRAFSEASVGPGPGAGSGSGTGPGGGSVLARQPSRMPSLFTSPQPTDASPSTRFSFFGSSRGTRDKDQPSGGGVQVEGGGIGNSDSAPSSSHIGSVELAAGGHLKSEVPEEDSTVIAIAAATVMSEPAAAGSPTAMEPEPQPASASASASAPAPAPATVSAAVPVPVPVPVPASTLTSAETSTAGNGNNSTAVTAPIAALQPSSSATAIFRPTTPGGSSGSARSSFSLLGALGFGSSSSSSSSSALATAAATATASSTASASAHNAQSANTNTKQPPAVAAGVTRTAQLSSPIPIPGPGPGLELFPSPIAGSSSLAISDAALPELLKDYVQTLASENRGLKDALTSSILQAQRVQAEYNKRMLELTEVRTRLEVAELEGQVGAAQVNEYRRQVESMTAELKRFSAGGGGKGGLKGSSFSSSRSPGPGPSRTASVEIPQQTTQQQHTRASPTRTSAEATVIAANTMTVKSGGSSSGGGSAGSSERSIADAIGSVTTLFSTPNLLPAVSASSAPPAASASAPAAAAAGAAAATPSPPRKRSPARSTRPFSAGHQGFARPSSHLSPMPGAAGGGHAQANSSSSSSSRTQSPLSRGKKGVNAVAMSLLEAVAEQRRPRSSPSLRGPGKRSKAAKGSKSGKMTDKAGAGGAGGAGAGAGARATSADRRQGEGRVTSSSSSVPAKPQAPRPSSAGGSPRRITTKRASTSADSSESR